MDLDSSDLSKTQVIAKNSPTARQEIAIPGAATCKWKSAAMTLRSLEQTSGSPASPLHDREVIY